MFVNTIELDERETKKLELLDGDYLKTIFTDSFMIVVRPEVPLLEVGGEQKTDASFLYDLHKEIKEALGFNYTENSEEILKIM